MSVLDREGRPLACRVCGGVRLKSTGCIRGPRTGESIPTGRCLDCGHRNAYPTAYRNAKSFDWDGVPFYLQNMAASRRRALITIARLLDLLGRPAAAATFLDIGCGIGFALAAAQELGLAAVGLDPEVRIAEYGREQLGVTIISGRLEDRPFGGRRFDLIYLEQVLEHIEAPGRFLELAKELLEPEGIIYVGVPPVNVLNRTATRLGLRRLRIARLANPLFDILFDPEEHVSAFTGRSMTCLASRAGLALTGLIPADFLRQRRVPLSRAQRAKHRLRSLLGRSGNGQFVLRWPRT